ncbi:MAG: VTT domain-containing protein [Planctomycetota bacterium]
MSTVALTPAHASVTRTRRLQRRVRLLSLSVLAISILLLVRSLPVDQLVAWSSAKVNQLGIWGPVTFGAIYWLGAVFFVPGSALTLAAGAVFGPLLGTTVVSVASTFAASTAFLIGRYFVRGTVAAWASKNPRFAATDRAIGAGGWRIIALLRLSPAMPFTLGNYLFGITAIRFWPYVLTSWIAMLPGTFMYVYLGHIGRESLNAAAGMNQTRSPAQWTLLVVGLIATVAVTWYVTRLARRAMKEQVQMPETSTPSSHANPDAMMARPWSSTIAMAALAVAVAGCAIFANTKRELVSSLLGPPAAQLKESYEEREGGPSFDHAAYDELLRRHVDADGLVNYVGLGTETSVLDLYIARLADVKLADYGRSERLALLINAYNAFTLRLILDHYPIASIREIPAAERWDARRWNLGGETLSLNQLEHEQVRPNFKEPRIHFALVCAAKGCPPLRNDAYSGARLEAQLAAQAAYVHTHERWYQFDANSRVLKLTRLYDWYGDDFVQSEGSVLTYVAKHAAELKRALDVDTNLSVQFLDYDWSLNAQEAR